MEEKSQDHGRQKAVAPDLPPYSTCPHRPVQAVSWTRRHGSA